jgi:hypothetical protein
LYLEAQRRIAECRNWDADAAELVQRIRGAVGKVDDVHAVLRFWSEFVLICGGLGPARAAGRFKYSFRGGRILFQCGDRTDGPTYELASAVGALPVEYALGACRTEGALE